MDPDVVCVINRIHDESAFQGYGVVVCPYEAVLYLYIAAADDVDAVSVELPADHVHSVDDHSIGLRDYQVPSRTVNHRYVLDLEVAGAAVVCVCAYEEVAPAVHVVSMVQHLFSRKDAVSGYGDVAADGLDVGIDLSALVDVQGLSGSQVYCAGVMLTFPVVFYIICSSCRLV